MYLCYGNYVQYTGIIISGHQFIDVGVYQSISRIVFID